VAAELEPLRITPEASQGHSGVFTGFTAAMYDFHREVMKTGRGMDRLAGALRRFNTGPPPLCIDGHEYHRRQRRRVKRRK
jgi:hypothetical protein